MFLSRHNFQIAQKCFQRLPSSIAIFPRMTFVTEAEERFLQKKRRKFEEVKNMLATRAEEYKRETDVEKRFQRDQKALLHYRKMNERYEQFSLLKSPLIIKYAAKNQLESEKNNYTVDRQLCNKLADYGFIPMEDPFSRYQKLVKRNNDMLVQVTYLIKQRRKIKPPERDYNEEHNMMMKKIRKFIPMRMSTVREDTIPLEDQDSGRHYLDAFLEPKEDATIVDIVLIKKNGKAIKFECICANNEMRIGRILHSHYSRELADSFTPIKNMQGKYFSIYYDNLSTKLQKAFVEYLYSVGLPPDVGLVAEFMSINKEQRMYMNWLKSLHELEGETDDENENEDIL
ncbi:unnamed protein product [Moneuplotes crassus]|uniref:Uncharacterized protein n=1 Tax=Euplotes crassus TaxID=5936 RepID=A0AAD1U6P5_EUPCR|nr:unnamed protein product [Moneuplotes crassus]